MFHHKLTLADEDWGNDPPFLAPKHQLFFRLILASQKDVWLLKSAGAHGTKLRQWPAERVFKEPPTSPLQMIHFNINKHPTQVLCHASCHSFTGLLPLKKWKLYQKNSLSKWASRLDHMWDEPNMTRTQKRDWNEVQTRKKSNVGTNPCKWSVVESPWSMKHNEPYCWIWNTAHLFLHLSRLQCAQPGVIHSFATCQIHYSSDGVWAVVW